MDTDIVSRNVSVRMVRPDLEHIPSHPVPDDYAVRWYRPGDEALWVRVEAAAERYKAITAADFDGVFGDCPEALPARQLFLLDFTGAAVGTATAWFDDDHDGERRGRIHWVAVVPRCQGRGLSKPLMSLACRRLRELGHDKAFLATSTARVPAINLYLRFGFVPEIRSDEDEGIWREMASHLRPSPGLAGADR